MSPDRILADVPAEPPVRGFTTGPIRALRLTTPRPPVDSEHGLRVRRAMAAASARYPGPVGRLVAAELLAYAEQGWRGDPRGLSERLVAGLLGETRADGVPRG